MPPKIFLRKFPKNKENEVCKPEAVGEDFLIDSTVYTVPVASDGSGNTVDNFQLVSHSKAKEYCMNNDTKDWDVSDYNNNVINNVMLDENFEDLKQYDMGNITSEFIDQFLKDDSIYDFCDTSQSVLQAVNNVEDFNFVKPI